MSAISETFFRRDGTGVRGRAFVGVLGPKKYKASFHRIVAYSNICAAFDKLRDVVPGTQLRAEPIMECSVIATLTDEHSCQRNASLGRRGLQIILELRVFTSCIKRNIQRLEC